METTQERERLHRFVRRSAVREPDLGNAAVIEVLRHLHRMRFMHADQLTRLISPEAQRSLKYELMCLFNHRYVVRPGAQWVWRRWYRRQKGEGGSAPLLYAEATRGVRLLEYLKLIEPDYRDHAERNRELADYLPFIRHEVFRSEVYVDFHVACRESERLTLRYADELVQDWYDADRLRVPELDREIEPDLSLFIDGLITEPSFLPIEVDCATEPNTRYSSYHLQSLRQKYEGYQAYAAAKRHREQFGVNNMRVLTVTTGGDEKVEHLAETAYEVCQGEGGGRFLATSYEAFKRDGPLAVTWLDANMKEVTLGVSA